ncbi:SAG family member [Eimeria mitis]|uniref:SAG family member n=1 Tax=Eimeria mitis TaxID=44415 RepID=U6K5B1_9EIME|nr:SAG family member [Eimeria mitis]CDJ32935.1 SAG family member [Eimeria mitis]
MASLLLQSLAAVAVLGATAALGGNTSKNSAKKIDCSTHMNAVRTLAGFSPLELGTTEQEQLPILGSESALDTEYVEKVCTAMKADKAPSEKAATLTAYTENTAPYNKIQNVSFISLFNPKENAKVDCAYFICPAAEEDADEPKNRNDDEPPSEDPEPEATTDKDLKAILCITTPSALEANKAPYE